MHYVKKTIAVLLAVLLVLLIAANQASADHEVCWERNKMHAYLLGFGEEPVRSERDENGMLYERWEGPNGWTILVYPNEETACAVEWAGRQRQGNAVEVPGEDA